MYLLGVGILLLIMKFLDVGFMMEASWWWVALPFLLAIAWWAWADSSGYTKRKQSEKIDQRKRERIEKQRAALGMRTRKR